MPRHAFIDESGTQDDQQIMTVALIVLEGAQSAQKILKSILKEVFPKHFKNTRNEFKPKLHYIDMSRKYRLIIGNVLAAHPIDCFISAFYHDGSEKSHETRSAIYTLLVKSCLKQAFCCHDNLLVTIAQQGGWAYYQDELIQELQNVAAEISRQGRFCKSKFQFQSASKSGIQLVDFYAGATRDFLLKHVDNRLEDPYSLIKTQIRDIKVESWEYKPKRKGKN